MWVHGFYHTGMTVCDKHNAPEFCQAQVSPLCSLKEQRRFSARATHPYTVVTKSRWTTFRGVFVGHTQVLPSLVHKSTRPVIKVMNDTCDCPRLRQKGPLPSPISWLRAVPCLDNLANMTISWSYNTKRQAKKVLGSMPDGDNLPTRNSARDEVTLDNNCCWLNNRAVS